MDDFGSPIAKKRRGEQSATIHNKTLKEESMGGMGTMRDGNAKTMKSPTCSVMLKEATAGLALKQVFGDVLTPALCGSVISPLQGTERGRGQGFVPIAAKPSTSNLRAAF